MEKIPKDKLHWDMHAFAMDVLKHVAVQTHTNWEIFLEPVIKKHKTIFKNYEKRRHDKGGETENVSVV